MGRTHAARCRGHAAAQSPDGEIARDGHSIAANRRMKNGSPPSSDEDCEPSLSGGDPARCAFFLDLDGTLVEIAQQPGAVHVASELPALIADLYAAANGAVALISGRPIADIDRLLQMPQLPIGGQHGAERRDAHAHVHRHAVDDHAMSILRAQVYAWSVVHPGLLIEDKGLSLALHYRGAPELEQVLDLLARRAVEDTHGAFQLQPGKMVLEIKPSGRDKGRAIEEFLSEPPFVGRIPVFVGDDVTDEYGFLAVNARGGVSIKVGDGNSAATLRLRNVDAVHRWLRGVLASARRNE